MATAMDNEVREAFLVEAGDLLDALGDQLIALETDPGEQELLNSVFRTFHTIKGGAGFVAVRPMVELCHHAEELLNEARNRRLVLSADHIDCLLRALDLLLDMMQALRDERAVADAPADLLASLAAAQPVVAPPVATAPPAAPAVPAQDAVEAAFLAMIDAAPTVDGIADDEFERLLDELHGDGKAPGVPAPVAASEGIDDAEFEALLDSIYGKGGTPGQSATPSPGASAPLATPPAPVAPAPAAAAPPTPAAKGDTAASHRADSTIRVDTERIDALVNAAGELVLVRNRLATLAAQQGTSSEMERAVGNLDRVAGDLQTAALRMRMQPIGRLFQRFPRIVRDLARQLGKQVTLALEGEDTNLDRALVESLADPLVHLLRNAVDHGLEDTEARVRAGKPAQGTVTLAAAQQGERIIISIGDDGRGMDPDVLRSKAIEKGVIDAEQARLLEPDECFALIFRPGFSTSTEISSVSGRGVGMDVVKTAVAALGGTIDIESRQGVGTTIRIGIPLTLAIMRALMVRVGARMLALPLANVLEVFDIDKRAMRSLDGRIVAAHRGRPLPLASLALWAGVAPDAGERVHIAVVQVGHQQLGLVVAQVFGREEVMVKPLGSHLRKLAGVAGATITGDGRVALVLDLVTLAQVPLPPALAGGG